MLSLLNNIQGDYMFKLKAYAVPQDPQTGRGGKTKLDGWGHPLQTIYLRPNQFQHFRGEEYRRIMKHQIQFAHDLNQAIEQEQGFFIDNGWNRLPKIYNDPRSYDVATHIDDMVEHYEKGHDPCLSMVLRQQYFVNRLSEELQSHSIAERYGIDLEIVNSTNPVIKRFIENGVFTKPVPGSIYSKIFE